MSAYYPGLLRALNESYGLGEIASIKRLKRGRFVVQFTSDVNALAAYSLRADGLVYLCAAQYGAWVPCTQAVFTVGNLAAFVAHVGTVRALSAECW